MGLSFLIEVKPEEKNAACFTDDIFINIFLKV